MDERRSKGSCVSGRMFSCLVKTSLIGCLGVLLCEVYLFTMISLCTVELAAKSLPTKCQTIFVSLTHAYMPHSVVLD